MLVAADIAVHDAKDSGGNRVMLYSGQSGPDLTWTHRIRDALAEDRFVLHGQPIIDLQSGEVSHHELLIRMRDHDGSLIAPDAFLPTAERFGLINAIDNLQEAREFSAALAAIGCQLAIDDFGTGFGSLTYLKHIPARFVKIDREFVTDLAKSATDRHVVRAVVGIARSLGQRTVAEGVENAEALALVRELGVDYVQGFHTGRPAQMWPAPAELVETDVAA